MAPIRPAPSREGACGGRGSAKGVPSASPVSPGPPFAGPPFQWAPFRLDCATGSASQVSRVGVIVAGAPVTGGRRDRRGRGRRRCRRDGRGRRRGDGRHELRDRPCGHGRVERRLRRRDRRVVVRVRRLGLRDGLLLRALGRLDQLLRLHLGHVGVARLRVEGEELLELLHLRAGLLVGREARGCLHDLIEGERLARHGGSALPDALRDPLREDERGLGHGDHLLLVFERGLNVGSVELRKPLRVVLSERRRRSSSPPGGPDSRPWSPPFGWAGSRRRSGGSRSVASGSPARRWPGS